jgi:hypothetical protein
MTAHESVLASAQDIVDTLYNLTAAVNFTGEDEKEEDEVNDYTALMDAREPLLKQLEALRGKLTAADRATPEFAEIVKCINDIADMDNSLNAYFKQVQDELRGSIKEIKKGRQINSAYHADAMYDDAVHVDTKK